MIDTPISDKYNLSLNQEYSAEHWPEWCYELGLLLDPYVTLLGYTNAQRIEIAVKAFVESHRK